MSEHYRNKKRGTTYEVLFEGTMKTAVTALDDEPVVIYRADHTDNVWVRPVSEFYDGRFEHLPLPDSTPPTVPQGAEIDALIERLIASLRPAEPSSNEGPPTGSHVSAIADETGAEGLMDPSSASIPLPAGMRERVIAVLTPLAKTAIGAEIEEDSDLILYKNAGRCITVGDVLDARALLAELTQAAPPATHSPDEVKL